MKQVRFGESVFNTLVLRVLEILVLPYTVLTGGLFCRLTMSKSATVSPSQKHYLLLTVLLLSVWIADGLENISGVEVKSDPQGNGKYITVKEGSSMSIRCNLTGGHDGVKWYNSQGLLKGEEDTLAEENMETVVRSCLCSVFVQVRSGRFRKMVT